VLLEGKVALVTGAGRGIGRALSVELAQRGARVVLTGLHQEQLDDLQTEITTNGGQAIALVCDVREERHIRKMVNDALAAYGKIDLLINNAGIGAGGDIRLITDDDWQHVLSVNLWGMVWAVRAVLPHMFERGSGYIVNIASGSGLFAPALWIPYATSKFAVVGFSEGLCAAIRPKGIGVSVVCPMWVQTDILKGPPPRLVEPPENRASPRNGGVRRTWQQLVNRLPGHQMTPATAAQRIIRGITRERFLVYTHNWARLIVIARAIAPEMFSRLWDRINAMDEERHRTAAQG
jgi:NAD(P)-dependent dehydrogenase (short-subunit alcohol dehydrogenase family)